MSLPSVQILHKPWKNSYSPIINNPTIGAYSLFDLFYYTDSYSNIKKRYSEDLTSNGSSTGLQLAHDIICYNTDLYTSNTVDSSRSTFSEWCKTGMDIGYVEFDQRSRYRTVNLTINGNTVPIKIYDKAAALQPEYVTEIINNSGILHRTLSGTTPDDSTWASAQYVPFTVGIDSDTDIRNSDIVLCDEDTVWKKTLVTQSNLSSYTSMCLNITSLYSLIYYVLESNSGIDATALGVSTSTPDPLGFNFSSDAEFSDSVIDILKHTYLWIRCGFFGDYVSPDSFNQDLNQDANVQHKNLMISSTGDFNRYDDSFDAFTYQVVDTKTTSFDENTVYYIKSSSSLNKSYQVASDVTSSNFSDYTIKNSAGDEVSADLYVQIPVTTDSMDSEESRSYLTQTAPSEDILSKRIATEASVSSYDQSDTTNALSIVKALRIASEKDDSSVIGSLWNDASSRETSGAESISSLDRLSSPMYFDPESKISYADIIASEHIPVLVPSDGNIVTEGRISSPTIDELWIYLKKLVCGHNADEVNNESSSVDDGYIVNNSGITKSYSVGDENYERTYTRQNSQDTRLEEGKEIVFATSTKDSSGTEKIVYAKGDPIELSIKRTVKDGAYTDSNLLVSNWVTSPDSFKMAVFDFLQMEESDVLKFDEEYKTGTYHVSHEIKSNVAKTTNEVKDIGLETDQNYTTDSNQEHLTTASGTSVYAPRAKPYSLRELEASLKNVKYNLNTLMRYLVVNYVTNNQLAHRTNQSSTTEEGCSNRNGTSLYQFHRDYNSRIATPNTYFNKNNADPTKIVYSNVDGTIEKGGANAVFDDSGENSYTRNTDATKYGSAITLTSDSDEVLDNGYNSSDVYLAADGTWRYIFDHVRVPTLHVEY